MTAGRRARRAAAWGLIAGAAALAGAALLSAGAGAETATDYDADGDGLIEVVTLAQLDAMRYDLDGDGAVAAGDEAAYGAAFPGRDAGAEGRMGCPSGACGGYELDADLDFDENGDGRITETGDPSYWNGGAGWDPIGESTDDPFDTVFRGNGHTVSHLYVDRPGSDGVGLFGTTGDLGSDISGVGLIGVRVTGGELTGGLAGDAGGPITASWVTGEVTGSYAVGGLAGYSIGDVTACWSSASVSASGDVETEPAVSYTRSAGGLVGEFDGAAMKASYAVGAVSGGQATGGLVGNLAAASVAASWAGGPVAGAAPATSGGLVGANDINGDVFGEETYAASYWDAGATGQSASAGGSARTWSALRGATDYAGDFAGWNLDLDGDGDADRPWDFGTDRQHPVLVYGGLAAADQRVAWIRADSGGAPVAGEPLVAGLYDKTSRAAAVPAAVSATCDGGSAAAKRAWKWERSDDGASGWADVSSSNGSACSYVYVPTAADAGKRLRAAAPLAAGGEAVTLVTAAVRAGSGAAAAAARYARGHAPPRAGQAVSAAKLPAHRKRAPWRWQRCDGNGVEAACVLLPPRVPSWSRTPEAADAGGYLRAFVHYEDASGVRRRAATPLAGPVAAAAASGSSAHPCALDPMACGIHP